MLSLLNSFKAEVLDKSPEALLPQNLTSRWLRVLEASANQLVGAAVQDDEPVEEHNPAYALAAVTALLFAKSSGADEITESVERMHELCSYYHVELTAERMRRDRSLKFEFEPPTLGSILTPRLMS